MPASTIQQIGIKLLAKIVASVLLLQADMSNGQLASSTPTICAYTTSYLHPRRVRQKWPGRKEVSLPDSLDLRALFSWVDPFQLERKQAIGRPVFCPAA